MSATEDRGDVKTTGPGMPAWLYLNQFGSLINDCFGTLPYMVGSATRGKVWRDIDVRLILDDEVFEHWCGRPSRPYYTSPRWAALVMAFTALGRQMTGLPIDFQIISQSASDEHYPHQKREPLGIRLQDLEATP